MKQSFKTLPEELLPREKLKYYGASKLGNDELLAILLQSGTKEKNVLDLAREILNFSKGLEGLSEMSFSDLESICGLGKSKVSIILSAVELARRLTLKKDRFKEILNTPQKAQEIFLALLEEDSQENFMVLYLDKGYHYIFSETVYKGSVNWVSASPREVFQRAFKHKAYYLVLAHNHPNDQLFPSEKDRKLTKTYIKAAEILDLKILDHIILGKEKKYFSFRENQLLK